MTKNTTTSAPPTSSSRRESNSGPSRAASKLRCFGGPEAYGSTPEASARDRHALETNTPPADIATENKALRERVAFLELCIRCHAANLGGRYRDADHRLYAPVFAGDFMKMLGAR